MTDIISSLKYVVTDASILSSIKTGSDHRLVRKKLRFDFNSERTKIITTSSKRRYEKQGLAFLQGSFQVDLINRFEGLDVLNLDVDYINKLLCRTINKTAKKHLETPRKKINKLTKETLDLIGNKNKLHNQSALDKKELDKINKLINKSIKQDIRSFNTNKL